MSLSRVIKTGGALFTGQGVALCTQLLLPPVFIHNYSVAAYGEWLTLTAAVNYLGTLNFGLQTFANNQVCISHNRGESEEVDVVQATAFAILLAIVIATAIVTASVFFLPLAAWMNLKTDAKDVNLTIYLLGLQVLIRMISGFIVGSFLVVGKPYRGGHWNNAQAMLSLAGTIGLVMLHARFSVIAAQQAGTLLLCVILSVIDLRIVAPVVFPRLRYFRRSRVGEILKPSSYFAMLFSSNFLVYQLPVVIMQRILGPTNVVVFSVTRTIYSMSRQALTILSVAIAPEIVELYGQRNWSRLVRLYEMSERLICALVPVVNLGTFLATPILMAVWLHKPALYQIDVCIYMALISAVSGIKEHKYQFQASVNEHSQMAKFLFASYVGMVALTIPGVQFYGVDGFLVLWLATELIQLIFILWLNQRLFAHVARLDFSPVYRLGVLLVLAMGLCGWFAFAHLRNSLMETAGITALAVLALLGITYQLFGVNELKISLLSRLRRA